MIIQRVTLTAARVTPAAELARWVELDRVHHADEDAMVKRLIAEAWTRVERHTGRLWLPAASSGPRLCSVEFTAAAGERVSANPAYPHSPGHSIVGVDRWDADTAAWVIVTGVKTPDPWAFEIPDTGAWRVRSTWTADATVPGHVEHAAHLVAIYLNEHRGDAAYGGKLGSQAGLMQRSGAADVLRHDRPVSV